LGKRETVLTSEDILIENYLVTAYWDLVKDVQKTKQRQIHYCQTCKCLEVCKEAECDFRCDYFQRHGYCIAKMKQYEVRRILDKAEKNAV